MSLFWKDRDPLLLASASAARKLLLERAGVPVEVHPVDVDERAVERTALASGASSEDVALRLAAAKAARGAHEKPDRLVLGSDQILVFEGSILHKPRDRNELRRRLCEMAGRPHRLYSSVCIRRGSIVLYEFVDCAQLMFRAFPDSFATRYIDGAPEDILNCAGGYALEGSGVQLMERVDGQYATVLGLPLLQVLEQFRRLGVLHA